MAEKISKWEKFKRFCKRNMTVTWAKHFSYQVFSFIMSIVIIVAVANYAFQKSYDERELTFVEDFTITAHTGAFDTEDNSLESVKVSIEHKVQVLEIDVRCRPDSTVVIGHDIIMTNNDGVELSTVFELIKDSDVLVNLDIKETRALKGLRKLITEYGLENQVFLTGIEYLQVKSVKEDCPDIAYYLNYKPSRFKIFTEDYQQKIVELMEKTGAVGINCNYVYASKTLANTLHKNGYKLSVWTVDKKSSLKRALVCNPDNITTHNPDRVKQLIDNWGK